MAILLGLTQYRQQQIYREQRFLAPFTISYPVARNKREVEESKVDVVIKHLDMKMAEKWGGAGAGGGGGGGGGGEMG